MPLSVRSDDVRRLLCVACVTLAVLLIANDAHADLYVQAALYDFQEDSATGGVRLQAYADASSSYPTVAVYAGLRTPSLATLCSNSDSTETEGSAATDCLYWVYPGSADEGDYSTLGEGGDQHDFVGCQTSWMNLALRITSVQMSSTPCGSSGDFIWNPVCSNDCQGGAICATQTPGQSYKVKYQLRLTTFFSWCTPVTYTSSNSAQCYPT